jgi:hypothetical protein
VERSTEKCYCNISASWKYFPLRMNTRNHAPGRELGGGIEAVAAVEAVDVADVIEAVAAMEAVARQGP